MSSSASNIAFVEEYDEDAHAVVPDTRRIATLTRTDLNPLSSDDGLGLDATGPSFPIEDRGYDSNAPSSPHAFSRRSSISSEPQPVRNLSATSGGEDWDHLSHPSGYSHGASSLFEGLDRLRSLNSSSPTGATVAPRYSQSPAAPSYPTSRHSRSASSADGSPPTLASAAVPYPYRQRPRRQTSTSAAPPFYSTSPYPPSIPYAPPAYNPYYPAYDPASVPIQDSHTPAPPLGSAYKSAYYYPQAGLGYPNHGTGTSGSASAAPRPVAQPSEGMDTPRKVEGRRKRPIHRFINLRRLQSDREGEDLENTPMPWRTFTREFPLNLPGKPQLQLEKYNIIGSRLISGAGSDQDNAAILTYDVAEGGQRPSETRWMHYTSDTMELESFKAEVLRLKEVPENAFPIITALFKELGQVYEKPFVHGRYLEPVVRRFAAGDNSEDGSETKCISEVVFIAFPYLSLEPLHSHPSVSRESSHPVRSLLQYHYTFVSTLSRDKHQVARDAGNKHDALHVPQVWILLINNDLIVSTGPVDVDTLRGKYVHLEQAEPPASTPEQRQVRVTGIQEKQYCFPLSQCRTWFEFIKGFVSVLEPGSPMATLFLEDSWRNTLELLIGDESISEDNWLDTIHKSQHGDITIRFAQKTESPEPKHIPPTMSDNRLMLFPKGHLVSKETYHGISPAPRPRDSHYYNVYPSYYTSTPTPYYNEPWRPNPYTGIHPYHSPDDAQALMLRPSRTTHNTHSPDNQATKTRRVTLDDRIKTQSTQPIQLTDLSGVQLQIPWRIGLSWTNMYPVVALKMQFTAEHRHSFITDNYVLDSPDGPITSTDWDEKVYPGISVTIKLNGRTQDGKMEDAQTRLAQIEQQSAPGNDQEGDATPAINNAAETDIRTASDNDTNSILSMDVHPWDNMSSSEQVSNKDMTGLDAKVNVFDYLICEKDDDEYLAKEGSPGTMNPFRYQVDNDAWKTKEMLVTDPLMLESSSSSSSVGFTTSNSSSRSSSSPTISSATSPQSNLLSGGTTSSVGGPSLPASANVSKVRPLFEWRNIEAKASPQQPGLSVYGESNGRKADEGNDCDVAALLEGCDKEAFYILGSHPAESTMMNNISKSTFMQLQVEIERTKVSFLQLADDSYNHAPEREAWKRREKVIKAALHLIDTFIPLHYQKLDESWLIGKFFGAIYALVRGSYPDPYLDRIESILSYLGKSVDRIHAGVAYNTKEGPTEPALPPALVHAFPPLVFLVCIGSQLSEIQCRGWHNLQIWTERCYDRLTHGKYELINMARTGQYSEAKVFTRVDADDIIALVMRRLAELPRAKVPWQQKTKDGFNLLEMYRNHISQLEFRARQTPSSDLFDEIQQLKEEIQILHLVLDQQLVVLESTLEVLPSPDDLPTKLNSCCIAHSQQLLKQTQHDLLQLERMAEKAAVGLRYMLEVRKESNSKAITIFTIVTVIFLPLSFVTSYLGMNSVDIRGGTFTQGLFWAIAIPIAASLVGGLWVALRFRRRIRRFVVEKLGSCRRLCRNILRGAA